MRIMGMRAGFGVLMVAWLSAGPAVFGDDKPPAGKATNKVLNLLEKHKDEYVANETPTVLEIGPARYLTIDGKGAPGGEDFSKKVSALMGVAYGINMRHKFSGKNYMVAPLEGLWWAPEGKTDFVKEPKETWNWKLLIRTPEFVTEDDLASVAGRMKAEDKSSFAEVRLETIREGRCVQALHVGPYEKEPETIATMLAYAEKQGLSPHGKHHEIYLNDPSRVPPEELRTILRQPVR